MAKSRKFEIDKGTLLAIVIGLPVIVLIFYYIATMATGKVYDATAGADLTAKIRLMASAGSGSSSTNLYEVNGVVLATGEEALAATEAPAAFYTKTYNTLEIDPTISNEFSYALRTQYSYAPENLAEAIVKYGIVNTFYDLQTTISITLKPLAEYDTRFAGEGVNEYSYTLGIVVYVLDEFTNTLSVQLNAAPADAANRLTYTPIICEVASIPFAR